jgi:D-3-phosphoglycerate dehydrogenase
MISTVMVTDCTYQHLDYERAVLEPLGCTVIGQQCQTEQEVVERCAGAHALLNQYAPLTRRVLSQLPDCKMVVRYGVGYDSVDVEAASDYGIMVVNVPDYGMQEVADHTLGLLLATIRKIPAIDADIRHGRWGDNPFHPILGLQHKRVGLLGFGNIAREVAQRARAFNMQVMAYDPFVAADVFARHQVESASWQQVLSQADVVCVHLPLMAETRHFINAERLALMKPTAYLVNTARGGIINGSDLADALTRGVIAGAGLDVFEQEPLPLDHPLRTAPNTVLTCHIAWYSEDSLVRLQQYAALEIARVVQGGWPKSVVNRAALVAKGIMPAS